MLVKKVNPDWYPSEKPNLLVGETVEISDPKTLILNGTVTAVGPNGEHITAFDLYNEMIPSETEEFTAYMNMRKAEATKAALEKQQTELKDELEKEEPKKEEAKEEEKPEVYVAKKDR